VKQTGFPREKRRPLPRHEENSGMVGMAPGIKKMATARDGNPEVVEKRGTVGTVRKFLQEAQPGKRTWTGG